MPEFVTVFGIVAVVLTIAALVSGVVEKSPLSLALLFLGFGFLMGERGLGVIEITPTDRTLETVATLTLALVLFLDAVKLQVDDMGRRWLIPVLILGPGTAIIIVLGAVPLALFMGFGWVLAFIGGRSWHRPTRWCFETSFETGGSRARSGRYSGSRRERTTWSSSRSCSC